MSDDDERHTPDPAEENDPVARFFAEARSQLPEEPATDLDWQRIMQGARRNSRRRSRMTLLTSAAVAVLAVFAVLLWQQHGLTGGVQRGQAIPGSSSDIVHNGQPTSSASAVSSAQSPTKVPASFKTWSLSNAGQSTLYALGSQTCGNDTCPVLLKSGTNGRTWNAVHSFTGTDVSAATDGNDIATIQPQRAITETRFATPNLGYVFGGDLWVTRDSGTSFTKMRHPGETVLDVEINQGQGVLLSADNCAQGICNGPIYVSRFDPNSGSISKATAEVTPQSSISAGNVVVQHGDVFVQLTAAGSSAAIAPMRLDGSKLTGLKAAACSGTALQSVTAATITKELQLFALCNPQQSGTDTSYTIVRSDDAGNTWQSVSSGALTLPRLGRVWLAAADADHLVASAGGPRDTAGVPAQGGAGSLMQSTNGGHGFGAVPAPKGASLPSTGFDWTASAGGAYFYSVPRTTHGFWMTSSFGGPWTVVDPR